MTSHVQASSVLVTPCKYSRVMPSAAGASATTSPAAIPTNATTDASTSVFDASTPTILSAPSHYETPAGVADAVRLGSWSLLAGSSKSSASDDLHPSSSTKSFGAAASLTDGIAAVISAHSAALASALCAQVSEREQELIARSDAQLSREQEERAAERKSLQAEVAAGQRLLIKFRAAAAISVEDHGRFKERAVGLMGLQAAQRRRRQCFDAWRAGWRWVVGFVSGPRLGIARFDGSARQLRGCFCCGRDRVILLPLLPEILIENLTCGYGCASACLLLT
jgi:hypothetical protein